MSSPGRRKHASALQATASSREPSSWKTDRWFGPPSAHVPSRRKEGPRRSIGHAAAGENDGSVMSSMPRASDVTDQDGGKVSGTVPSVNTTLGRPGRVAGSG